MKGIVGSQKIAAALCARHVRFDSRLPSSFLKVFNPQLLHFL
jgi:Protein of unknown function (DUF819)